MLVQRRAGHGGRGHCLLSTAGPLWAQRAQGQELRAEWTPAGVLPEGSTPLQQAKQSGMWLFQVVAEAGKILTFHRGRGKNARGPDAGDAGGPEVPPGTRNPGFLDAILSSGASPWKGLAPLQ